LDHGSSTEYSTPSLGTWACSTPAIAAKVSHLIIAKVTIANEPRSAEANAAETGFGLVAATDGTGSREVAATDGTGGISAAAGSMMTRAIVESYFARIGVAASSVVVDPGLMTFLSEYPLDLAVTMVVATVGKRVVPCDSIA
jgi:hypothetical protein